MDHVYEAISFLQDKIKKLDIEISESVLDDKRYMTLIRAQFAISDCLTVINNGKENIYNKK